MSMAILSWNKIILPTDKVHFTHRFLFSENYNIIFSLIETEMLEYCYELIISQ